MTYDLLDAWCGALPGTSLVRQWGGARVWKVGGKVFAIGGWNGEAVGVTFKVERGTFDLLAELPGLRPAPYMASRGLSWIQWTGPGAMADDDLRARVRESYALVAAGLPRAVRAGLGRA